jgi:hypothetical protein
MTDSNEPGPQGGTISKRTLNMLLASAIVAGILVSWLVTHKEKYFPELYASHGVTEHHSTSQTLILDSLNRPGSSDTISSTTIETPEEPVMKPSTDVNVETAGKFALIAGSFHRMENATSLQKSISRFNNAITPEIILASINDTTFYRVVVARSDQYPRLESIKSDLTDAGFKDTWICAIRE